VNMIIIAAAAPFSQFDNWFLESHLSRRNSFVVTGDVYCVSYCIVVVHLT